MEAVCIQMKSSELTEVPSVSLYSVWLLPLCHTGLQLCDPLDLLFNTKFLNKNDINPSIYTQPTP